jgi:hypothetical protein
VAYDGRSIRGGGARLPGGPTAPLVGRRCGACCGSLACGSCGLCRHGDACGAEPAARGCGGWTRPGRCGCLHGWLRPGCRPPSRLSAGGACPRVPLARLPRRALPFARPSCRFGVSVCAPSPGLVPLPSVWVLCVSALVSGSASDRARPRPTESVPPPSGHLTENPARRNADNFGFFLSTVISFPHPATIQAGWPCPWLEPDGLTPFFASHPLCFGVS